MIASWIVVTLLGALVGDVSGEAFSSTANLVHLVDSERAMIPTLEQYIQQEQQRLDDVKRYVTRPSSKSSKSSNA